MWRHPWVEILRNGSLLDEPDLVFRDDDMGSLHRRCWVHLKAGYAGIRKTGSPAVAAFVEDEIAQAPLEKGSASRLQLRFIKAPGDADLLEELEVVLPLHPGEPKFKVIGEFFSRGPGAEDFREPIGERLLPRRMQYLFRPQPRLLSREGIDEPPFTAFIGGRLMVRPAWEFRRVRHGSVADQVGRDRRSTPLEARYARAGEGGWDAAATAKRSTVGTRLGFDRRSRQFR